MNLPLMPAGELVLADTNIPSEMEVIALIAYLKKHERTGPDALSPSFFEDGCSVNIGVR